MTVATATDADVADEAMSLVATSAGGNIADASTKSATGTIWASAVNWATNYFTLTGPGVLPETATTTGTGASTVTTQANALITATMTTAQTHDVTIPVSTVDGASGTPALNATALGGVNRDYTALPTGSSITIPAGQLSGSINVGLWDDNVDEEPTQYFTVQSSTVLGATAAVNGDDVEVGITDDDATPSVKIGNAGAVVEGGALGFPVTLSNPSERNVTVNFTTADGDNLDSSNAASSGTDYTTTAKTPLSIPNYANTTTVLVPTLTDAAIEGPENVKASLNTPTNATLGTPTTASGVIYDAQAAPAVTLNTTAVPSTGTDPYSFLEGATGEVATRINLSVSPTTSTIPVKIDYSFGGGTATNGVDYKGTAGTITLPVGTSTASIPVTIVGDKLYESPNETFNVNLSSSNNSISTASVGAYPFTIQEGTDDVQPTWTIGSVSVPEGNTGVTTAKVPISLTAPTNQDTTFNVAIADGTATDSGVSTGTTVGDNDYDLPASRTVTIPAGATSANLEIPINADTVYEKDETIAVTPTLTGGNVGASVPSGSQHAATLTIANDDAKPLMTFNQTSGSEGTTLRVTGTIVGVSQYPYTLAVAFASGTSPDAATAGLDFDAPTTPVAVSVARGFSGQLPAALADVYLSPDNIDEATENFTATATETTGTLTGFTTSVGTYKISDDPGDLPPAASVRDETIGETEGSVDVHVDLAFSGDTTSTTQTVTVPYWTEDGTAKSDSDYTAQKGTLSFAPGELTKTINVPIARDKIKEGAEKFFVKLGTPGPAGAVITKGTGEVTIKANDGTTAPEPGAPTITGPDVITGAVAVSISGKADPGSTVELWSAPMGDDEAEFMKINETTADEDGSYEFSRWIGQGTRFQTKVGDKPSEEMSVRVMQAPVFVASSPKKGLVSLAVQGNPRAPGQTVIVQRYSNGAWVNTTWRGTTGKDNVWRATVKQSSHSTWTLRAFVAGYTPTGILPGYSVAKKLTVK